RTSAATRATASATPSRRPWWMRSPLSGTSSFTSSHSLTTTHRSGGTMPLLDQRRRRPEIMDQPDLNRADHEHALGGLARINFLSGSARILWPALKALGREL